ncbi:outer membrane beta-barrel protein [Myroides sp. BIT-d1]|uniref:Outer membrane beta-barrel protein n=1 Tax=Myroides albus TaxID=2562892 RepID=A0A6I3LKU9_9FLAO|nr:outer membrane beta-barrel protein [Myroides albus]MTG99248.1 outer membrane beta-barrel protein [Myroides albus]
MNTKILYSALVVFISLITHAQKITVEGTGFFIQPAKHEVSSERSSMGYAFSLGYEYDFLPQWSVSTSIGYAKQNYRFYQARNQGGYSKEDIESDSFEFSYKTSGYSEKIHTQNLRIPLTVQYQTKGILSWYVSSGMAFSIPLAKSESTIKIDKVSTKGYYPKWDALLSGPDFMGFGEFNKVSDTEKYWLKTGYSWLIETGVKQRLSHDSHLYIGVYFELGLNDIRPKGKADNFAVIHGNDLAKPLEYSSVWSDERFKDRNFKNKMIGLKLRYAFSL